MANLTLRLPRSTHDQLKTLAKHEGVSLNQLVLTAVAEKISALRSAHLFANLREPVSRAEFEAALARVPDVDPDPWDVWTRTRSEPSETPADD